jgi:hypothetical protein
MLEPGFCLKPFMHILSRTNCTSGTMNVQVHGEAWITVFLNGECTTDLVRNVKESQHLHGLNEAFSIFVEPLDSLKNSACA